MIRNVSKYFFILILSFLFVSAVYIQAAAPTDGLVGYWMFDEGTGTSVDDSSVNTNTGTLINSPTWTTGKIGQALDFDGVDDRVQVSASASLNNLEDQGGGGMTVSVWINPRSAGETGVGDIIGKGTAANGGWRISNTSNGRYQFLKDYDGTNLSVLSPSNTRTLDTWQHLVFTWDGSATATNVKIYKDGVLLDRNVDTNATGNKVSDASNNLNIGNLAAATTFDGLIDDLRIYNRVLSAEEVLDVYNDLGGEEVEDDVPPEISSIAATNIGTSTATITWTTNEAATSRVHYGLTTSYGSFTAVSSATTTSHSKNLSGLASSTTYHYQVISADDSGNISTSTDNTFVTDSELGVEAIIIDHTNTNLAEIPDEAITSAKTITSVSRHASVGGWIGKAGTSGLTDLSELDAKYDRSSFTFDGRGNPGWMAKMDDLGVDDVSSDVEGGYVDHNPDYDVYYPWLNYADTIDAINGAIDWEYYRDAMLDLESAYPEKIFVWSTLSIKSTGNGDYFEAKEDFNENVRAYAEANNKILFDLADIQSHDPSGNHHVNDDGYEILYSSYSTDGQHPDTALGRQQVAKGFWWLMARLSGWDGETEESSVTIPDAPTGLSVSDVESRSVLLSWTDNSDDESTFVVYGSTDGIEFDTVGEAISDSTSFEVTGLSPNTTYWHYVVAQNSAGSSSPTSTISTTTLNVSEQLLVHYRFESGIPETTLIDSENSINGALLGTFTLSEDKIEGDGSFAFDGTSSYSLVPHNSILEDISNAITISFWGKISRSNSNDYVIDKADSFSIDLQQVGNDKPHATLYIEGTPYTLEGIEAVDRNTWVHQVLTYDKDDGVIKLYINGEMVSSGSATGVIDISNEDIFVGKNEDDDIFGGNLDDMRIYNYALSQSEIEVLFTEGNPVVEEDEPERSTTRSGSRQAVRQILLPSISPVNIVNAIDTYRPILPTSKPTLSVTPVSSVTPSSSTNPTPSTIPTSSTTLNPITPNISTTSDQVSKQKRNIAEKVGSFIKNIFKSVFSIFGF